MIILALGGLCIVVAVLLIRFPEMVRVLKQHDHPQWKLLGSPPEYAFSKSLGVFSWILDSAYEHSSSEEVINEGRRSLRRAKMAKYLLIVGVLLCVIGFSASLYGLSV